MSIDPEERYATANDMRRALEEYLARSGPVVTETQVAELTRERVGGVVDERTSLIRERTRNSAQVPEAPFSPPAESSSSKISNPSASAIRSVQPLVTPSGSFTPPPAPAPYAYPHPPQAPQQDTTARTALFGIGIGVLVFAVGGAGIFLLRSSKDTPPPPAPAKVAAPPVATPAKPAKEAKPPPAAPKKSDITIRTVSPKGRVAFELDGKRLVGAEPKVPRPPAGKFSVLKASAVGYHTDTLRLDADTPDILEVMLAKLDEPAPAKTSTSGSSPASTPRETKPTKPKKPPKLDIPENPF